MQRLSIEMMIFLFCKKTTLALRINPMSRGILQTLSIYVMAKKKIQTIPDSVQQFEDETKFVRPQVQFLF